MRFKRAIDVIRRTGVIPLPIALVIGTPLGAFGLILGWEIGRWVGEGVIAGLAIGTAGLCAIERGNATDHESRQDQHDEAELQRQLEPFIPEVHNAIRRLFDDISVSMAWKSLRLGDELQVDAVGRRTGEWPRVIVLWPTEFGATMHLSMLDGQTLAHFLGRREEIADAFFVDSVEVRRVRPGVLEMDLIAVPVRSVQFDQVVARVQDQELVAAVNRLRSPTALGAWMRLGLAIAEKGDLPAEWPVVVPGPGDPGVWKTRVGLQVRCRIPTGLDVEAFRAKAARLSPAFGVHKVIVDQADHPSCVWLHFINVDLLAAPAALPWPPTSDTVDLNALCLGVLEDGTDWLLPLLGAHYLIVGKTGSGKSSLIWAILAALGPAIRDGQVQIHAIDLKEGVELVHGRALYTDWAYGVDQALTMLERLVEDVMTKRGHAFRTYSETTGRILRKHVATTREPHHVIFVDELMTLLKLPGPQKVDVVDDKTGDNMKIRVTELAANRMIALLSKARALGITLIGTTQDPTKAVMDMVRDLFTAIIGLRLGSISQEQIVFGPGYRELGVNCLHLPPGVLYTLGEDGSAAQRARVFYVDDARIPDIRQRYKPKGKKRSDENETPGSDVTAPGKNETHAEVLAFPGGEMVECAALDCTNVFKREKVGRPRVYCSPACKQRDFERRKAQDEAEGR